MNNYANEFGKQCRKNPRNIPKFTINHQRFCCAIEKNILNIRPRTIIANPFKKRGILRDGIKRKGDKIRIGYMKHG